jgi:hypothetical protein
MTAQISCTLWVAARAPEPKVRHGPSVYRVCRADRPSAFLPPRASDPGASQSGCNQTEYTPPVCKPDKNATSGTSGLWPSSEQQRSLDSNLASQSTNDDSLGGEFALLRALNKSNSQRPPGKFVLDFLDANEDAAACVEKDNAMDTITSRNTMGAERGVYTAGLTEAVSLFGDGETPGTDGDCEAHIVPSRGKDDILAMMDALGPM